MEDIMLRDKEKISSSNESQIKLEKVLSSHIDTVIKIATEVFTYEQNIPENLIPINEEMKPIWWCAKAGEDIIGVVAAWNESNQWHWGRFAVDKNLRGLGIGKKLAMFSLNEVFNLGAEKIFIEARDITVRMLAQLGCKVIGEPVDFYGEAVTPIIIKRCDFTNAVKQQEK